LLEQAGASCDLFHARAAAQSIAAMPPGADQKAALKGLLSTWAPVEPAMALDWLRSFPSTNAQPEAVKSVVKSWSGQEPAAVTNWLAQLPPDTDTNGLAEIFLDTVAGKYPAFAAQWTESVTNETQRQAFQIQVARQWLKMDPAAAEHWINRLELPADVKASLKDVSH
jgi:hypothetical protein